MWWSRRVGIRHQIKRLQDELKTLRKERRLLEAKGCFSDRELAEKEARLEEYSRRIQILELELDRLYLLQHSGAEREA
jgi:hypothetical protein